MENFIVQGPLGKIECIVEKNRSKKNAVLIMAHGFRGSRDSGGRAQGVAYQLAEHCDVVRFNFTGTKIISLQIAEIKAVIEKVRILQPKCHIYLLGRSLGGAASLITASMDSNIERLILWATPNNLRETFRYVMTEEYYARLDAGETLHFTDERGECALTPNFLTDFDKYDLDNILKNWQQRPVLLLHCTEDATVLVAQAQKNAALLGQWGTLKLFCGGDHSFTEYSGQAGAFIAQWLAGLDSTLIE